MISNSYARLELKNVLVISVTELVQVLKDLLHCPRSLRNCSSCGCEFKDVIIFSLRVHVPSCNSMFLEIVDQNCNVCSRWGLTSESHNTNITPCVLHSQGLCNTPRHFVICFGMSLSMLTLRSDASYANSSLSNDVVCVVTDSLPKVYDCSCRGQRIFAIFSHWIIRPRSFGVVVQAIIVRTFSSTAV